MKAVSKLFNMTNLQEEHPNTDENKPQHPWGRGTEASNKSDQCKGMEARADGKRVEPRKSTTRMILGGEAATSSPESHWRGDVTPQVSSPGETDK